MVDGPVAKRLLAELKEEPDSWQLAKEKWRRTYDYVPVRCETCNRKLRKTESKWAGVGPACCKKGNE